MHNSEELAPKLSLLKPASVCRLLITFANSLDQDQAQPQWIPSV